MPVRVARCGRPPSQFVGGWEVGLLIFLVLLYVGGAFINPAFFGTTDALHRATARCRPLRRDGRRHDLCHRQQGSRPVGRLDSTGWSASSSRLSSRRLLRLRPGAALLFCVFSARGRAGQRRAGDNPERAGVHRDADHAPHRPRHGARPHRRQEHRLSGQGEGIRCFFIGENNAFGFNNQIFIFLVVAVVGAIVLAKTRGATRLSPLAATSRPPTMPASRPAGCACAPISCRRFCATLAGLMAIAQDKGVTSQSGLSAELIVIASVIIGGASILGGRGRVSEAVSAPCSPY